MIFKDLDSTSNMVDMLDVGASIVWRYPMLSWETCSLFRTLMLKPVHPIQARDDLFKKGTVDYKGEEKLCLRKAVKKVGSVRATLCKCTTCKRHTYLSKHFAKSPNEKKQETIKNRFWL